VCNLGTDCIKTPPLTMLFIITFVSVAVETCLSCRYHAKDKTNMSRYLQNSDFWNGIYWKLFFYVCGQTSIDPIFRVCCVWGYEDFCLEYNIL
jgi:hypothetical protein